MKIGILTQPLHFNYGGVLQNWALQQVLKHMGHEPLKLERNSRDKISFSRKYAANLKTFSLKLFGKGGNRRYNKLLRTSRLDLSGLGLMVTKLLSSEDELLLASEGIEAFIVGSDQVWREEYSPAIEEFFCSFLPNDDNRPRIAYAASFGKPKDYISLEKMPACKRLLLGFSAVSVREREGQEILARDFNYHKSQLVLDPTMLLSADDYWALMSTPKLNRPYIAAYFLDDVEVKIKCLREIAESIGISGIDLMVTKYDSCKEARVPSIGEWIASIANAEYVVTDSFHGMVFSLIFHKSFVVLANAERGLDRYRTILEPLGLMNRLVSVESIPDLGSLGNINWMTVDQHIDIERKQSLDFLRKALER